MISGEIEVIQFSPIRSMLKAKFGHDPEGYLSAGFKNFT